jgi:hypothetical protein
MGVPAHISDDLKNRQVPMIEIPSGVAKTKYSSGRNDINSQEYVKGRSSSSLVTSNLRSLAFGVIDAPLICKHGLVEGAIKG